MFRPKALCIALVCAGFILGNNSPASAGDFREVYHFRGRSHGNNDGGLPLASLLDVSGILYGTTRSGGAFKTHSCRSGCGTVFSLNLATGGETVLHSFGKSSDGSQPFGSLINIGGILFGTTAYGGTSGKCNDTCGAVFSLDPVTGVEKVVHSFGKGTDGSIPSERLVNVGGIIYGTTQIGGSSKACNGGCGTVFSLDPTTGVEKVLYSFKSGSDGELPNSLLNVDNTLYGSTYVGGESNSGTLFSFNIVTGVEQVLYSFMGEYDGALPAARVIYLDGLLYGTTELGGGPEGYGTVFAVNLTTGLEQIVHSFQGGDDGFTPTASLFSQGGILYGTTEFGGGPAANGTVYSVNPGTNAETVIHSFDKRRYGFSPTGSLIKVGAWLYGTTCCGGASGWGTVFAVKP